MFKTPIEVQTDSQLKSLLGNDFQEFIIKLLFSVHGVDVFQDLRNTKDQGSDGLICPDVSIACYGPEVKEFSSFKKKISGDYGKYLKNWSKRYPKWRIYMNRDPSPKEIQLVESFSNECQIWGPRRVKEDLEGLPWNKKYRLYQMLRIDEAIIGRDFLKPIFEDLMTDRFQGNPIRYKEKAPDIEAKIKANYSLREIEEEISLMTLTFEQQATVEEILQTYDENELNRIKGTVLSQFNLIPLTPPFGDRIKTLCRTYEAKYNTGSDDGLSLYIRGFIFVLFAQCLMGISPPTAGRIVDGSSAS